MRILITNDDGIEGEGLAVLTKAAKKIGDVTVIAPKFEQSGKSHAIEIHKPFEVKRVDYMDGVISYTVDSTPADCVRYALCGLKEKYDLVLSGINCGLNIGEDIVYSGTCGAAFEAAYFGAYAVSVSTEPGGFSGIEPHLESVYRYFKEHGLLGIHPLYNVNIPKSADGIRITRQGGPYFRDNFSDEGNNMVLARGYSAYEERGDLTLDTETVFSGCISITPLSVGRTDETVYRHLTE